MMTSSMHLESMESSVGLYYNKDILEEAGIERGAGCRSSMDKNGIYGYSGKTEANNG